MISKYYQKNKEKLQKEARERYQNLSEEEKTKSAINKRYQNFTKKEKEEGRHYYQEHKQKLPEYRRNYYLAHKKYFLICFEDPRVIKFIFLD